MSGYLQRLGERAVGRTGIVPRTLTRFEPPQAAAAEPMAAAAPPNRIGMPAPEPAPRHGRPHPAPNAATDPTEPPHDNDAAAARNVEAVLAPHAEAAVALGAEVAPRDAVTAPVAPVGPSPDASTPALPAGPRQWAAGPAASAMQSPLHEAGVPTLIAVQPLPALPGAAGNAVVLRRQPAQQPPAQHDPDPVHVTIGRVEVRAVFAPAPTAARPAAGAAPASTSLHDYLQRRGRS